jgi:predicted dehydrogenase
LDPAKAGQAARSFGARAFTDPAEMLATARPHLVDIVTRVDSHRPLAELCCAHAAGVIVQKPFAPSPEDAVAIVAAAARAGVWLAVHENFRFQPPMRRVIDLIDAGTIGAPNWAQLQFRTGWDVYATQPYFLTETRLCIADVGVHVLDCARRIMGEVTHLTAETQRRNPRLVGEDTATILLRHAGGGVSVVDCTYEARALPDPFPETLVRVEGPKGCIVLRAGGGIEVTEAGTLRDLAPDYPNPAWVDPRWAVAQTGCLEACRHFLARFRAGAPAETAGPDNLRTFALVEAAYASAAGGLRVVPPCLEVP